MAQSLTLILKKTIFDKASTLIITPESLDYQQTSLSKFEIEEIRYGTKPISGFQSTIGTMYCIDVKSLLGAILKIRLASVYGIRKKLLGEKYRVIVSVLLENYIKDIAQSFINLFKSNVDFDLLGITFTQAGIIPDKKSQLIPWNELGAKNYSTYFTIFSKRNPDNYKAFYYLKDWNTDVLHSVSEYILKEKKLL